jgi:hypothetical protein
VPQMPRPDRLHPSRDPRDEPGTDDHERLMHPHGNATWFPWPYVTGDLASYVHAATAAHRALSRDYLKHAESETLPPLCGGTHSEILLGGVNDLPHTMRPTCRGALDAIGRLSGRRYGLLRVWRHFGLDCDAAEAWRCDEQAQP